MMKTMEHQENWGRGGTLEAIPLDEKQHGYVKNGCVSNRIVNFEKIRHGFPQNYDDGRKK